MRARSNVLLLSRREAMREAVLGHLESTGAQTRCVPDAEGAMRELERPCPHVLLIDAESRRALVPVLDIRQTPAGRRLPIAALADGRLADVSAQALAVGADDVVSAACTDAEFLLRINTLVGVALAQAELDRRSDLMAEFSAGPETHAAEPQHVLLVGPGGGDQVQVVTALGGAGMTFAGSIRSAIELLTGAELSAVVLTAVPGAGEIELLQTALRDRPEHGDVPVILIAPPHDPIDPGAALEHGITEVVNQPCPSELMRLRLGCRLRRQQLRAQLRHGHAGGVAAAVMDRLTSLYSHGFVHAYLGQVLRDRSLRGAPISIAALDLAGTSRLNERFGYAAVDRAIAGIGRLIARYCRAEDLPARIGGDRFCVVMPGVEEDDAQRITMRIGDAAARRGQTASESQPFPIDLRQGSATAEERERPVDLLDRAFGSAKCRGLRVVS